MDRFPCAAVDEPKSDRLLELDSLAQLDLIVALETSFAVEIPNDFVDKMHSIDDLEAMIEQLTA
jgi:acyl carrier protein